MLQYENSTNDPARHSTGNSTGSGSDNATPPASGAAGQHARQAPWERSYRSEDARSETSTSDGATSDAELSNAGLSGAASAGDQPTVVHPVMSNESGQTADSASVAASRVDRDAPTEMIDARALQAALAADASTDAVGSAPSDAPAGSGLPAPGDHSAGPGFAEAPTVMIPPSARPSGPSSGPQADQPTKISEPVQYSQPSQPSQSYPAQLQPAQSYPTQSYPAQSYGAQSYGAPQNSPATAVFGADQFGAEHDQQDSAADAHVAASSTDGTEPPADETETAKKRPGWFIPAIIAGALIVLLGGAYLVDWFVTKDDVAKGTTIGGVDVGGLTPEEAVAKLEADMGARYATPVTLKAHGQDVVLDPAAAGLAADLPASVAAAGTRSASPISRISELFGKTTELPIVVNSDDAALTAWVTQVAGSTDVAAVEGAVSLDGVTVSVVEPVVGQHLDIPGSTTLIENTWATGNPAALTGVELPVTQEPVRASQAGVDLATTELSAILAGPLTVNAGATPISIPVETLAAALVVAPDAGEGFSVTVDEAAIKANYQAAVEATQTTPADASIAIVDNAPLLTPGVDGAVVDWTATDAALTAALRSPDHVLTVVYAITPPEVTTAEIEALGIKEVIGEFTTGGFSYASGQNVKTAAGEIDGALVLAGETFSLNNYTGPRGIEQGYIESGIIQDGVAAKAIGGGISQLATTLYNASYFAGMEDVEHKAHSYYISRYPEGREATVFQNPDGSSVIDVAFKNTYGTAIIIQTVWTESDITVKIWGTKTVEVTSATGDRYNYTSAPTKTIPYGQSCSPSNGSSGFSVDNTRTITDLAGTVISAETTTTVYNGQVAVTCEPAPVVETPAPGETPGATPGG